MLDKARRFVFRHAWSLSLGILSSVAFMRLGSEVSEGELAPFDDALGGWIQAQRGSWDGTMRTLTWFGSFWTQCAVCAFVALLLLALRKRHEAVFLVLSSAGAALICGGLKLIFHRARPDLALQYLLTMPQSFSFPSGHTMGSTGVIASLVVIVFALRAPLLLRVPAAFAGAFLVMGIASSRVYFGVHYASDVIGGQLGGAAWVAAVTGWFYPRLLPAERSG